MKLPLALLAVAAAAIVAGCGSSHDGGTARRITVPAYGVIPAATITGAAPSSADARICREEAGSFADQAVAYLAHSGPQAAYPADLYYVIMRESLADLQARGCDPGILGAALERRLAPGQRTALLADIPAAMAADVRAALAAAGAS